MTSPSISLRAVGGVRSPMLSDRNLGVVVEPSTGDVLVVVPRLQGTQVSVWRLRADRLEPVALGQAALGFSLAERPTSVWLHTRRDGSIGAAWRLERPSRKKKMIETVWDGERFVPTSAPYAVSGEELPVFDPVRGVLVLLSLSGDVIVESREGRVERRAVRFTIDRWVEPCFSTSLGRVVFVAQVSTEARLCTWDGSSVEVLPVEIRRGQANTRVSVFDGAPFDADVVVVEDERRWFKVRGSEVKKMVRRATGRSQFVVDVTRRKLWLAEGGYDGLLFRFGPDGIRPFMEPVWGARTVASTSGPDFMVVAPYGQPAQVFGVGGAESEQRAADLWRPMAALPDGTLVTSHGKKLTFSPRSGAPTTVTIPGRHLGRPLALVAGAGGTLHLLVSVGEEGEESEVVHRRYHQGSWSGPTPGPRGRHEQTLLVADDGDGRLVAVLRRRGDRTGPRVAWFDGTAWTEEPMRLGPAWRPVPGRHGDDLLPWCALGRDPVTGHRLMVVLGAQGPMLAVYAADGHWAIVAPIELSPPVGPSGEGGLGKRLLDLHNHSLFTLRDADRSVVMVGAAGDESGACWRLEGSYAAVVDALPAPGKIPAPAPDTDALPRRARRP